MNYRIGGEFEINAGELSRLPIDNFSPTLKSKKMWLDTGRSAIYAALKTIISQGGSRIAWLPAYSCESIVLAFEALEFDVNYYSMGEDLQTPSGLPEDIENQTLLFIHYFGKSNSVMENWLRKKKTEQTVYVIEDAVQACFNKNLGEVGDFVVSSLRKFTEQPDGGLLCSDFSFEPIELEPVDENFVSKKIVAKLLRGMDKNESLYLELFNESETKLNNTVTPRHMSWFSKYLMRRIDINEVKSKRVNNYQSLCSRFKSDKNFSEKIKPLFGNFEETEVPLGFPVKIKASQRNSFRKYLANKQIYCPIHWVLDHLTPVKNLEADIKLSEEILTLPIDQRMGEAHLDYMWTVLQDYQYEN